MSSFLRVIRGLTISQTLFVKYKSNPTTKRKEIYSKIKLLKENIESQVNMNSSNKRKNRTSIEELQKLEKGLVDAKSEYFLSIQNVLEPVQVTKLLIFDKKFKKVLKDELKNKKNKRR